MKTIPFGKIDWQGAKRVLVHAVLLGIGYLVMVGEQWVSGHNFGAYQGLAMGLNTIAFTYAEKVFSQYNVPLRSE